MKNKLETPIYIEETEVPKSKHIEWDEIFNAVPKGKARVFSEKEVNLRTVRSSLKYKHTRGKFLHLKCVIRKPKAYVINSNKRD